MFGVLDISTSGLVAQRTRMDVIATNLAMSDVTEDQAGQPNPYRRRYCVFQTGSSFDKELGVTVANVNQDMSDFRLEYDPGHKDAIKEGPQQGYVRYPNVDRTLEYVDAMEAARAYEANIAAFDLSKSMIVRSIRLLG